MADLPGPRVALPDSERKPQPTWLASTHMTIQPIPAIVRAANAKIAIRMPSSFAVLLRYLDRRFLSLQCSHSGATRRVGADQTLAGVRGDP